MPRFYEQVVGVPIYEDVDITAPRLIGMEQLCPSLAYIWI